MLLLLQDPSAVASDGSGFISRHNNDRTAANTLAACKLAGLPYSTCVHWNVVPWCVLDPAKGEVSGAVRRMSSQIVRAREYLIEVLRLLPNLRAIVLMGDAAQGAWLAAFDGRGSAARTVAGLSILSCPHPSPRNWHRTRKVDGRRYQDVIVETLTRAAEIAASGDAGPRTLIARPPTGSATLETLSDWSEWVDFETAVATAPTQPGVYMAALPGSAVTIYVGMAGERRGRGIRGRLHAYSTGRGVVSGFGEAAMDRALQDTDWIEKQLRELEEGGQSRTRDWALAAITRLRPLIRWTVTADTASARALERAVLTELADEDLWNKAR